MKRPPGSKDSIHYLTPSMKRIAKSVGRRNSNAVARQVVKHRRIRECIVRELGKLIRKDMKKICSKKVSSMLRKSTAEAMKSFAWADFTKELEDTSPIFYRILKECVDRKRRKVSKRKTNTIDDTTVIGMCAALLLRHRNANMNLVQRIISVLLYSGHAPKKVVIYYRKFHAVTTF